MSLYLQSVAGYACWPRVPCSWSRQGLAGALVSTARTIGLALGVAVMGAILGNAGGEVLTSRLPAGLQLNAGVAFVGAIVAFVLFRPSQAGARPVALLSRPETEAEVRTP